MSENDRLAGVQSKSTSPSSVALVAGSTCATSATNRRGFLKFACAAAVATQLDLMHAAATLLAAETSPAGKPRVAVVYFRKEAVAAPLAAVVDRRNWPKNSSCCTRSCKTLQRSMASTSAYSPIA